MKPGPRRRPHIQALADFRKRGGEFFNDHFQKTFAISQKFFIYHPKLLDALLLVLDTFNTENVTM